MKSMKVVLVNPITMDPSSSPSLGLAYIAHAVEQAGFLTHIIDANSRLGGYTIAKLRREVEALQPDVLGFSFCTASIPLVYKQIDALKGLAKLTIAGGPHPTDVPCEVLDNGVDVVVVGEGEKTVVDLLDNWESGGDWKSIDGIGFKQGEDIIINPDRPLIENIDEIKAARHLVNYENYFPKGEQRLFETILTSRGCPCKCTFCSSVAMGRKKVRLRSAGNIIEEIHELVDKYNFKYIRISDDTFTWKRERTVEICKLLIENFGNSVKWSCVTRANKVDPELLGLMHEAGCFRVTYGLESFIPETLIRIKKGITVGMALKAARSAKKVGMDSKLNIMEGWPWDKPEDIDETMSLVEKVSKEGIRFNTRGMLIPYPGTSIYKQYHKDYKFSNWWLDEKYDINKLLSRPWFLSGAIGTYYEDPILENDFFKYSAHMKKKYKELMKCKAVCFMGDSKPGFFLYSLLYILYFLSKSLYFLNPSLERITFKMITKTAFALGIRR